MTFLFAVVAFTESTIPSLLHDTISLLISISTLET